MQPVLPLPRLAVIDLDGTMVDSVPDLAWCVNGMLRELGMPERSESSVRRWVGNGVDRLVERALVDDIEGRPEPQLRARALPIFMRLYAEHGATDSRLYPGVEEGLDFLQKRGAHLACVTNKAEQFTLPLLEAMGLRSRFELVVSGDTLPERKPSPRPLLYAAEYFRVPPSAAVMIGDSRSDVTAARAAGFGCVCVSYGYNHGIDIRAEKPDVVIDSLAELPGVFAEDQSLP